MIKNLIADFKNGKSPLLGVLILVIFSFFSIFILPYLFTRNWGLASFNDTGAIGDTLNGIAGPFIAIAAAFLTFLAFWVQYQANQEQKKQFERQNQDQVFFRLFDAQESKIINSSFTIKDEEVKSYRLLEAIVLEFKVEIINECEKLGKTALTDSPELISDAHLQELFSFRFDSELPTGEEFKILKQNFLQDIMPQNSSDRWEHIRKHLNASVFERSKPRQLLIKIGVENFYKIDFNLRATIYKKAFQKIEEKYGSLLDGYLRGWEFIFSFSNKSLNNNLYTSFLKSQLSKFELIILFYYSASTFADNECIAFIKNNRILQNLHFYNNYFVNNPSTEVLEQEIYNIFLINLEN